MNFGEECVAEIQRELKLYQIVKYPKIAKIINELYDKQKGGESPCHEVKSQNTSQSSGEPESSNLEARQQNEVFSVGSFVESEMQERGWDLMTLAKKMPGQTDLNYLSVEIMIKLPDKNIVLDTETAAGLAKAFGTSPELWLSIDETWRSRPL